MNVALVLHGLVGTNEKYGTGDKEINIKIAYKHFKKHVLDKNSNVDVFFHTWSTEKERELVNLYNPVAYKSEKQPFYSGNSREQAINCRWKSTKEAIKLVNENSKQYDFILITRFDIAFLVDFDFSTFNKEKFYAQGPKGPRGNGVDLINDLWFVSNQENMTKFATLYDQLASDAYKPNLDSNHELARRHLIETGLDSILEYKFRRDWTGATGKSSSDTPLVRWHYYQKV